MTTLLRRFLRYNIIALLVLCALGSSPIFAQTDPSTVEITASASDVCVGEPLILTYKAVNFTSSEMFAYLGDEGVAWLNITVTDAKGQLVSRRPRIQKEARQARQDRSIFISAGDYTKGSLVLNRWFALDKPGTYQIFARPKLAYVTGDRMHIWDDQIQQSPDGMVAGEFTFKITVTPPVPARLRSAATRLAQEVLDGSANQFGQQDTLIDALFALPAAYAASTWRDLLNVSGSEDIIRKEKIRRLTGSVIARLSHSPSVEGADFLAWVTWQSGLPEQATIDARRALSSFHEEGPIDVKARVHGTFLKKEGKIPSFKPSSISYGS